MSASKPKSSRSASEGSSINFRFNILNLVDDSSTVSSGKGNILKSGIRRGRNRITLTSKYGVVSKCGSGNIIYLASGNGLKFISNKVISGLRTTKELGSINNSSRTAIESTKVNITSIECALSSNSTRRTAQM